MSFNFVAELLLPYYYPCNPFHFPGSLAMWLPLTSEVWAEVMCDISKMSSTLQSFPSTMATSEASWSKWGRYKWHFHQLRSLSGWGQTLPAWRGNPGPMQEPLNGGWYLIIVPEPDLCSQFSQSLDLNRSCVVVTGDVCVCTHVHMWTFILARLCPPRTQGSSQFHLWLSHGPRWILEHSKSSEIFVELIGLPFVSELRRSPNG